MLKKTTSDPLLVSDMKSSYQWLRARRLVHDDPILEQLPTPTLVTNGKIVVSFCSNNYLGLNKDPRILAAASEAVKKYGIGTCESRKLGGNHFLLEDLENLLAKFKRTESAMVFATGLMANVGVVAAIADVHHYMKIFYGKDGPEDVVIMTDRLNHRSIQMGAKLSQAEVVKFDHSDMEQLNEEMKKRKGRRILIVTDGVFSMDGDLAKLPEISEIASEYSATLMVDDAHCSGVWGKTGRGSGEHFDLESAIDIKMGTLSKAFGSMGGFIAADHDVIKMLKENTATYYFTSSLPPEQAAGLIVATNIIDNEGEVLRRKLWTNVYNVLRGVSEIGLEVPEQWSQIIPIMIGDEKLCFDAEKILLSEGVLVSSATVPAVAPGKARLRVTVNACHSDEHVEALMKGLRKVVNMLKLPVDVEKGKERWKSIQNMIPDYMQELLDL